jgi:hypothetical protein
MIEPHKLRHVNDVAIHTFGARHAPDGVRTGNPREYLRQRLQDEVAGYESVI